MSLGNHEIKERTERRIQTSLDKMSTFQNNFFYVEDKDFLDDNLRRMRINIISRYWCLERRDYDPPISNSLHSH